MKFLLTIFFLSFHFNFSSASGQKAGRLGEEAQPQRHNKKNPTIYKLKQVLAQTIRETMLSIYHRYNLYKEISISLMHDIELQQD